MEDNKLAIIGIVLTVIFGVVSVVSLCLTLRDIRDRKQKDDKNQKSGIQIFGFKFWNICVQIFQFIVLIFFSICPKKIEHKIPLKYRSEIICFVPCFIDIVAFLIVVNKSQIAFFDDCNRQIIAILSIFIVFSIRYMVSIKKCKKEGCNKQTIIKNLTEYKNIQNVK
jgi:hypothetical protein